MSATISTSDRVEKEVLDDKVAAILDRRTDKDIQNDKEDEDEDALLAELENDERIDGFRERRMQQLRDELLREKRMRELNQGVYVETMTEKDVLDLTTSRKYVIVHFFHSDFRRCKIMDVHLQTLAKKHFDTLITKIDVDNCPFLVEKLKVQVLPCVISFVDGKSVDRLVGFEGELGNNDSFDTKALEMRFLNSGVIQRAKTTDSTITKSIFGSTKKDYESDEDWDD